MTQLSEESLRTSYTIPSIVEIRVDIVEGIDRKLRYRVHEPVLSDRGRTLLNNFVYKVYRDLNLMKHLSTYGFSRKAYEVVVSLLKDYVRKEFSSRPTVIFRGSSSASRVSEAEIYNVAYYIVRDLMGYGPIDPLVRDQQVEDITCNGVELPVYVFHREFEWLETNVVFPNAEALERVIRVLAVRSGQEPSIANPIVEGVLRPEGYRVHIVLDAVSGRGTHSL